MKIHDPYRHSRRGTIIGTLAVAGTFLVGLMWLVVQMTGRSIVADDVVGDRVEGLAAEVTVVSDRYAIPYVTASNWADAWTAVGYLHAQHRLFQMDLTRRAGSGTLGEVLGPSAVGFDALARTIGFRRIALAILEKMPEETLEALQAYSNGVNAYIERSSGRFPFEFDALDYSPEPWSPLDCVIAMRMMGWELNTSFWTDMFYERVRRKVDSARYADLEPWYPSYSPTIIPGGQSPEPQLQAIRRADSTGPIDTVVIPGEWYFPPFADDRVELDTAELTSPADTGVTAEVRPHIPREMTTQLEASMERVMWLDEAFRDQLGIGGRSVGSNAWAVAPERSISGEAFLANDPHLQHSAPGKWYQVVLRVEDETLAGVTLPGIPFVLIGRNDGIAWGLTAMMADETDFYLERVDPGKNRVLHDGEWEPMKVIYDTLHPRDTLATPIRIRRTRHGPVISDVVQYLDRYPLPRIDPKIVSDGLGSPTGARDSMAMAIRWTGQEVTQELTALQRVNHAGNLKEFRSALRHGGVPSMSVVYADREGTIAWVPVVKLPIRPNTHFNRASPGWDSRFNWKGFHSMDAIPALVNPSQGYVAAANNKISNSLSFKVTDTWEDPSRAERLNDLLDDSSRIGFVDMSQMQADVTSPYFRYLTEFLLRSFPDSLKQGRKVQEALRLLRGWDGEMSPNSAASAIAIRWYLNLIQMTYADELGEDLFLHFVLTSQLPHKALRKHLMTESRWFDDVSTGEIEVRDDILRHALGDALDSLRARFGNWDLSSWRYGEIHTLTFEHPFGEQAPIDGLVNLGPYELGGDGTTLNNGEWRYTEPFEVRLGPSMRQLVDFGDTTSFMKSILNTGQSGQPMSKHYSDQTVIWLYNGYIDLHRSLPAEGEATEILRLIP